MNELLDNQVLLLIIAVTSVIMCMSNLAQACNNIIIVQQNYKTSERTIDSLHHALEGSRISSKLEAEKWENCFKANKVLLEKNKDLSDTILNLEEVIKAIGSSKVNL